MTSGDGCDSNCTFTACGNGVQTGGEGCDDGNLLNGDGCDSACKFEPDGAACPEDGNACTDEACNGAGTCVHANNTAACDDKNGCTLNDSSSGGVCGGELRLPWINEFEL